jgi:phage-related protein (TIGR01555 family)
MSILSRITDGLQSFATRMGTSNAKSETSIYAPRFLSDEQLETAFQTSWVCKKIVTIPAYDATRKWRQWVGPNAEKIQDYERRTRIKIAMKVREATVKARLYGGAAILIGVRGQEELDLPLNPDEVGTDDLLYTTVLTRHDLSAGPEERDPREERFGKPRYFMLHSGVGGNIIVHPSRLAEFYGDMSPRRDTGISYYRGWGEPVLNAIYEECRNLDATMSNMASLVFDAKTDVVQIPDLTMNITDEKYEEALLKRFEVARMLKGNHGLLMLDAEEVHSSKTYSFSGLADVSDRFMQVASGAADIPMTRLLGMSPAGQNSTGESDMLNFYDRITAIQSGDFESALTIFDRCLVNAAGGGSDDRFSWVPLKQMTENEVSEIRNRDADTLGKLQATGLYPDEQVASIGQQMYSASGLSIKGVLNGA